jgi:hypothetical protein
MTVPEICPQCWRLKIVADEICHKVKRRSRNQEVTKILLRKTIYMYIEVTKNYKNDSFENINKVAKIFEAVAREFVDDRNRSWSTLSSNLFFRISPFFLFSSI